MEKAVYGTRKSDLFLFILLILLLGLVFHAFFHLKAGRHDHRTFDERMDDFMNVGYYLISLLASLFIFSPVWIFRYKYLKELSLDFDEKTITLIKRSSKKPLILETENLSYFISHSTWFSTLEIYYEFLSSRGNPVKKRVIRLIGPNALFSFNQKTIRQIEHDLKKLEMKTVENHWRPKDEDPLLD